MPLVPSRDPSPSRFPPLPELCDLPDTRPVNGRAPWPAHVQASSRTRDAGDSTEDDAPLLPFSAMSPLVFGGAIRLAMRYGINAIDTSPYYHPSEFILGRVLKALRPEFARHTYFLLTKCGRYGPEKHHFDYSPERVRRSILHSCDVLGTRYLDVAMMHDVEFVAEQVGQSHGAGMDAAKAPSNVKIQSALGIDPASAATVRGPGDLKVLAALKELFKLKDEGIVRAVGISGYPLPVLLRIARLAATAPEGPKRPLDVILSYSNHTLHSDILPEYMALFSEQPNGTILNKPGKRESSQTLPRASEPAIASTGGLLQVPSLKGNDLEVDKDPPFLSLPETQHLFARRASFIGRNALWDTSSDSGLDPSMQSSYEASDSGPTPVLSPSESSPADSPVISPHSGRSPLFAPMNVPSPAGRVEMTSGSTNQSGLIPWHPPLILNGSPFSMGLLTSRGPPAWHPAKPELRVACEKSARALKDRNQELVEELNGMRKARRRSRNASYTSLASLNASPDPASSDALKSHAVRLGLAQIAEEEAMWRRAEAQTDIEASVLLPADRFARAALAYGLRGAEVPSRANRCWADAAVASVGGDKSADLFDYERPEPLLRTLTGLSTEAQINDAIETFRILDAGRRAYPDSVTSASTSTSAALFAVPDVLSFGMHAKTMVADIQAKLEALALSMQAGTERSRADAELREVEEDEGEEGETGDGRSLTSASPVLRAEDVEQQRYLRAFAQHCADEKLVLELMRERDVRRWSWASPV
ncbi:unnamed protein product [Tilletia caries]|uniref:NADP-dependent oxidoreductase domain-containing protein n=1 Tax=Tilletia caries TaxID=13290 RepID=A0ABN7ISP6_9BASI|nr:unnamed protein product [Tilletia caries]